MAFEKKTWYNDGVVPENAPEGTVAPALDADNMNRIESGIDELHKKKDYSFLSMSISLDDIPDTAIDHSQTTDDKTFVYFYKNLLPENIISGNSTFYGLALKKYVFPKDYCLFATRYGESSVCKSIGMEKVKKGEVFSIGELPLSGGGSANLYITIVEEDDDNLAAYIYVGSIHQSDYTSVSLENNFRYQTNLCILVPNQRIVEI